MTAFNAHSLPAESPLAQDMLFGASAIASYLFGCPGHRRAVYHLARSAYPPPPFFKMGGKLCARRSALNAWVAEREQSSSNQGG